METSFVFRVSVVYLQLIMKERIITKATELFLTLGFKSVTMDDIAKELAISKKTIYAHYENKTQLIGASTNHIFETISLGIEDICSLEKNPIEELYKIKKFIMVHLKNEKVSPQYQLQKYYPKIYEELKLKQFKIMETCVVDNIIRGMQQKIYRENLNIDFVFRIYFTGIISIKDNELFPQDKFSSSQLMDEYLEYHLRGIVTPDGRKILNNFITINQTYE